MEIRSLSPGHPAAAAGKPNAGLDRACQDMEAIFLKQLLAEMHRAGGNMMHGGSGGDIYQDLFDQQLAAELSRGSGIGLARMLRLQLERPRSDSDGSAASPRAPSPEARGGPALKVPRPGAD